MKTCICIILYNKYAHESTTLKRLIEFGVDKIMGNEIIIINNGPNSIDGESVLQNESIHLKEYLENKSLSYIYNELIKTNVSFDRYIIFDDDTPIDLDFFKNIDSHYRPGVDLQIPLVLGLSGSQRYYPLIDREVFNAEPPLVIDNSVEVISIGSGLVIYKSLIDKFENEGVELFDRRYALYGVDFSLFRRINVLNLKKNNILIQIATTMRHSLSRIDSEFSPWRHRERVYDYAISVRFYSKSIFHMVGGIVLFSGKELISFRYKNVYLLLKTIIKGRHPRA